MDVRFSLRRAGAAPVAALCLLMLYGCGGGGGSDSVVPPTPTSASSSATPVRLSVLVPREASSNVRHAAYVSSSTKSASLEVRSAVGERTLRTSCAQTCDFVADIPPGDVEFAMKLYDGPNATGNVLSSGNLTATVKIGQANLFSLVLGGAVATVAGVMRPYDAAAARSSLTLSYLDAAGRTIVGDDAFANPVALRIEGDASHHASLDISALTTPSQNQVTVRFAGGKPDAAARVIASVRGKDIGSVSLTPASISGGAPSEKAARAADFIDSVGVSAQITYPDTAYMSQYPKFKSMLLSSGIRHIRAGMWNILGPDPSGALYRDLAASGIKATLVTTVGRPIFYAGQYTDALPGFVDAFEGPNEYDLSRDPNWVDNLSAYQKQFYAYVKGHPSSASIPVIGPALVSSASYAKLGDLSAYMDYGAVHNYYGSQNPGSAGWGGPGFGSFYGTVKWWRGAAAQTSGARPVVTTETGSCTDTSKPGGVSYAVQGKYIPRIYLEQWNAGVPRTNLYEFLDNGTGCDGSYGLTTANLEPKPAYRTVSGLLGALKDANSTFETSSLSYELTGETKNAHHALFEKSDGTFVLVLWLETLGWDVASSRALNVTAQSVHIRVPDAPSSIALTTFDDAGNSSRTNPMRIGDGYDLSLSDHLSIVEIKR